MKTFRIVFPLCLLAMAVAFAGSAGNIPFGWLNKRLMVSQYMTTGEPTPVLPPVPPPADRPVNYECPKGKYIDCMPPLQGEKRNLCAPEFLDWIKRRCPDIQVVY